MTRRNRSLPEGPDPGERGAVFLGWLKERGGMRRVQDCERKCAENGFGAKDFVAGMGTVYIDLYCAGGGDRVIKLEDAVWADQWMTCYDLEVPHHRHRVRSTFGSVTGSSRKNCSPISRGPPTRTSRTFR